MARTRQLSDLQNDVLWQLDEVGSPKPAASDLTEPINQEWADLYDFLIESDTKWNLTKVPFVTQSGKDNYSFANDLALPDFYKLAGLDVQLSSSQWFPAHRFQFEQRDDYQLSDWSWPRRILYDVWGTSIQFVPIPTGAYNVRFFYYPAPARMVNATDTIDGVNGAELAIVYGAAQRAALMLEQFELADRLGQLKMQKWQRIVSTLRDRITGEAPMARVVRGRPANRGFRTWWRG